MSMNRDRGSLARVTTFDAVLVGSGINTLTAGALLARDGWSVCVLERSDRLGGAIRTEPDYTLPGFTHEVMSSWHPLFQGSAAYAELADDLHARGLEYVNTELPTGTAFPDGAAMFLGTSLEANVAEFDRALLHLDLDDRGHGGHRLLLRKWGPRAPAPRAGRSGTVRARSPFR